MPLNKENETNQTEVCHLIFAGGEVQTMKNYKRMCDVYGEEYFSQNDVYKWVKNGFATMRLNRKDSP